MSAEHAPAVSLRPMSPTEFDTWCEQSIRSYAEDLARSAGRPIEAAFARAKAQFAELLPDGAASENTWLFVIVDPDGAAAGTMWLGVHPERPTTGYVFDIEIDPTRRGRGIGRAAMLAAEQVLRRAGYAEVGLNVFGFNETATRLYGSIGYRIVSTQMLKTIPTGGDEATSTPP